MTLDPDSLYERATLLLAQAAMVRVAMRIAYNDGEVPELASKMEAYANALDDQAHRVWARADALKLEEIDVARVRGR